jgi:hypothetical protein
MIDFIDYIRGFRKTKGVNYFDYPAKVRKTLLVEAVKRANEMQLAVAESDRSIVSKRSRKHQFSV